jgi:hypothetical protein
VQSPRGEKLKNRVFGGLAGEWPFSPRWTLVGEVFGFSREASGDRNSAEFQLGLKYSFAPNLVLDAAAGRSLRSVGNSIRGTAGLTWLIDLSQVIKP